LFGKGQLDKHELGAHDLAHELGKQVTVAVDVATAEVTTDVLAALDLALLHLVRNAVDHGIEPAATRTAAGKPPRGRIEIRGGAQADRLELVVADDGAGIDFALVRERAAELGLGAPSGDARDERWVELLCHPGLSTRREATEVSGRGVGLDAVRASIHEVGGRLAMTSVANAGTTWTISIPVSPLQVETHLLRARDLHFPLVVEASWSTGAMAQGSVPLVDVAALLGISAGDQPIHGCTWLGRGDLTVGLASVQPAAQVHARKLVVTSASDLFDVITVDGVEGLLLRPQLLLAATSRMTRTYTRA
jgi:two-component system chemotaxis sensor kinase CheA